MKYLRPRPALLISSIALLLAASPGQADWKPVPGQIMTEWAEKVDPSKPLPNYPRPQLVREKWINLNGLWDYAITPKKAAQPTQFAGKILIPFCIESALSGVKKTLNNDQRLWYRRTFPAPELAENRLLLHFGAVDWETTVYFNGHSLGTHKGGYDSFSFDITDSLQAGDNELVVSVYDATKSPQARGKQNTTDIDKPDGAFYTPCTGIWQTVWMETVPGNHIDSLKIVPDIDTETFSVTVNGGTGTAKVTVFDGKTTVASETGKPGELIYLKIRKAKLWTPKSPFLYDLTVTLGKDTVKSYFGMRKIALARDGDGIIRPFLNNRFVFQSGPLDPGYWPDGIYTAPTDDALKFDIEITKKLGFNMIRKQMKVEPERWYYWCDKLGLLVWQDMPAGQVGTGAERPNPTRVGTDGKPVSQEAAQQFEGELYTLMEQHFNHPSIIQWTIFSEKLGQYDTPRLTLLAKALDDSRLICNASGWVDMKVGDIADIHSYPGPHSPNPEPNRAAVLGEFGGLGLVVPDHLWPGKAWSYKEMPDSKALTAQFLTLWKKVGKLKFNPGLSAAVYTQLTDVETQTDGLLTYDRKVVKVDIPKVSEALSDIDFP